MFQETPEEYMDRMEVMARLSEAHLEQWKGSLDFKDEDGIPEASLGFTNAALEWAQRSSQAAIDSFETYMKRGDPRPESARKQWFQKKGMKDHK